MFHTSKNERQTIAQITNIICNVLQCKTLVWPHLTCVNVSTMYLARSKTLVQKVLSHFNFIRFRFSSEALYNWNAIDVTLIIKWLIVFSFRTVHKVAINHWKDFGSNHLSRDKKKCVGYSVSPKLHLVAFRSYHLCGWNIKIL